MRQLQPPLLTRTVKGITRRCKAIRNLVEWKTAQALRHEAPWSQNRWGQCYQTISLSEYHYLRDGNPETYESTLVEQILRPGMTIVDVGANHGMFSLEAAHLVGGEGTIHAFEPAPTTRSLLLSNLRANRLDWVKVFPNALGETQGIARLRIHRELSGLNTLATQEITWNRKPLAADEIVEVPITTLDAHAESERIDRIDFLKIDVEGFELGVIRGARELLRSKRIDRIMLEIGDVTCATAQVEPLEILCELESLGYDLHEITPAGAVGERIRKFPSTTFSANFLATPVGG